MGIFKYCTRAAVLGVVLGAVGVVGYDIRGCCIEEGKTEAVLERAIKKAAGEDGVLSKREKAMLVKSLGYYNTVDEDKEIDFFPSNDQVGIRTGTHLEYVPREAVEDYLRDESQKSE